MDKRADVLTSKIVQVSDSHNEDHFCSWLLCEDGSLWLYNANFRDFRQVHPPHKLPTQAADLAEALEILRSITYYVRGNMINLGTLREIVAGANKLLDKHGA